MSSSTSSEFKVEVSTLLNDFHLETIYMPENPAPITSAEVNRPGLQIVGFFEYFNSSRIQIFGMTETTYMQGMTAIARESSLRAIFEQNVPAIIVTHGCNVFPEMLELAKEYETTVLRTQSLTSVFTSALIAYLNNKLAPRITRHGVLVEVYGEGILIMGESGVGKSETAVELMKRGHRLVADDAVEIRRVSAISLVGAAPEIIRHFIEIRGIGVVDVERIFGAGAVKDSEKIDMVIHLEAWQKGKQYDRLGLVDEYTNILGLDIPSLTIPVRPGRNLAIIVEVAAMNNRQKKMGYNAAEELNRRITERIG